MAVAQSSSDVIVIRYVLPVLLMTSRFCITADGTSCVFLSDKHNSRDSNQILPSDKDQQIPVVSCVPGAKSAVYDYLVCQLVL